MYKVLIVDDEPWVAIGIKMLVDWESLGYEVIGEAFNGIAALESITKYKPDVVLTDIRMPGLNGIELIEKIRQKQIHTKVILISGYAEFEYAQKAVQLGAFDYLLKQVDKKCLIDVLVRLHDTLDEKHQISRKRDIFLEDLFDILRLDSDVSISSFVKNKGMDLELPYYRFISLSFLQGALPEIEEETVIYSNIKCICLRTGRSKISILVNYDQDQNPDAVDKVISTAFAEAEYVGISSVGNSSSPVAKLYQQSDIALYSSLFLSYTRIMEYKMSDLSFFPKALLNIELAIKEQNHGQINQLLDELYRVCREEEILIDQLSMIYNQIITLYHKYYQEGSKINGLEYLGYYQLMYSFNSLEHLFEMLKCFLEEKNGAYIQISNETIKKILNFIDEKYTEDILLSFISKKFNISLGYLSTLIKKETGKTYTEYIIKKRLDLAKQLLKDETLSVEEIVRRVGYNDYFHFNKLFKKFVGITPSKYRKIN